MSRSFHISGILFLATAFILSLLASVSLPALDLVRVTFGMPMGPPGERALYIHELRLGVWAFCGFTADGDGACDVKHLGYQVAVVNPHNTSNAAVITYTSTQRLVVHPIATILTFPALLLALTPRPGARRLAPYITGIAAVLMLTALALDIALFALVKDAIDAFGDPTYTTDTAPGFWLTFAALMALILGAGALCFGRSAPGGAGRVPMQTPAMERFLAAIKEREMEGKEKA